MHEYWDESNQGRGNTGAGQGKGEGKDEKLTVQVPDKRIPQLVMFDVEFQPNGYQ